MQCLSGFELYSRWVPLWRALFTLNLYAFLVWLFRWFFVLDLNVTSLEIVKSGYGYFFF